ncbi:MAG: FliM/FliN family flagellar motor C-terminal domain-containing protein [Bryobacteraceae bacterium]
MSDNPMSNDAEYLDRLPVSLEVRLDERLSTVAEIKGFRPGATIPFEKPAGETLDLFVGNVLLASGEIVVTEGRIAFRITEFDSLREPARV